MFASWTSHSIILAQISTILTTPKLDVLDENTKKAILNMISMFAQHAELSLKLLESKTTRPITEIIWEYLLTGKTRDVPEEWFGTVFTANMFGKPIVHVMAGEGSNPKDLAEQFKSEYTKAFGKREYKITDTHLNTAEFLRMKFQGDSLKRLVERYREKHSSQFPTNISSKEYRQAVETHKDMMKKRLKRLQDLINKIGGDET